MRYIFPFTLFLFIVYFCAPVLSYAQEESSATSAPKAKADDTKSSTQTSEAEDSNIIYEKADMSNFAKMYWRVGRLKNNEDIYIDNFMRITNCDLFRDYFQNEFEWKSIRESARQYIEAKKNKFPLRFQYVQPLKLGKYDITTERFEIQDTYKINGIRRFEIQLTNSDTKVCGIADPLDGYPKSAVIEYTRPIMLPSIHVKKDVAKEYIEGKQAEFNDKTVVRMTEENLHSIRDAFIVSKFKVFSFTEDTYDGQGFLSSSLMGNLEEIEIYGDKDLTMLLYKKNFMPKKKKERVEEKVQKQQAEIEAEKAKEAIENPEKKPDDILPE